MNNTLHLMQPRAPAADVAAITEAARADLLTLRGARVFITGGTGYIGRWLLESLCHANLALNLQLHVTVLSRRPHAFAACYPHLAEDPAVTLIAGDVRDFQCAAGNGFTHLVHAATDVVAHTSPLDMFDVTTQGTHRVLAFAQRQGVKHVLLLSSGAVYGPFPEHLDRAPESLPCVTDVTTPRAAYGLGKIVSEWLGNACGQTCGFDFKSARIFAQIGPYLELNAHFAAGNFLRDVLQGRPVVIQGDGTPLRSYMYATDLVVWLWAILVRGQAGRAYNVGSDQAISIKDLAETIVRVSGVQGNDIHIQGQPAPGVAPSRYVPDTRLARQSLGLALSVPLEEALARTLEWHRAQASAQTTGAPMPTPHS